MKDKILIYNREFFKLSQTFLFQQAKILSEIYDVHLVAQKYVNPHDFDVSKFNKHIIFPAKNVISRAFNKLIRKIYQTNLSLDISSFFYLRNLLKDKRLKAVHAHFGPRALELLGFLKRKNIPLVVTFHGYDASQMLRNERYRSRLTELFDYASAIIVVSSHMIESLKLKDYMDKVYLMPCTVDPSKFQSKEKKSNSNKIKILHTGRLVGKKGVQDLIKVFKELSLEFDNIELHIAGDGKEEDACKALVKELDIDDKVIFYGKVPHEKVKQLLNLVDIFVLNSRTDENGDMEGTPVTLLEAMYLGKAVVSTKHAGIPDVVDHAKNGLLAKERANNELKNCIEELILNKQLRNKLGQQAKKTIEESYTVESMREKIFDVFQNV